MWIRNDRKTIKFSDERCVICEGVEIADMPGLQYCNLLSGVFQAVLGLRGFKGTTYQETCRALGDPECMWTTKSE